MAKKQLGYVEMEWVCPRCGSKNPGPQKTCTNCGGPQPKEVKFQQREGQQLIKGEEAEKIAQAAPDVHCGFCGTRNKADALVCIQCGADLKEGTKRESGEVVGAFSSAPVPDRPCPTCGQPNPAGALTCKNCGASLATPVAAAPPLAVSSTRKPVKISPVMVVVGIVGLIGLVILCVVVAGALGRTESVTSSVQSTAWKTQMVVEEFQPVTLQGWADEIPGGAEVGACEFRFAYTASEPQPVSTEVCGTPYTVDQGTGFGEVVQDCVYETYAEYCEYRVEQWVTVDRLSLQGNNLFPEFPQASLNNAQRSGVSSAEYTILFNTDQGLLEYRTSDLNLYQQAQIGSHWTLKINSSGAIVSAQPEP
ncbi:MAG TPA: zinc ribbon domain-containing protein [Bellilinea sp.]|nr:zinc ribbon domain-containing protein [Bellilinea sp.]